MNLNLRNQKNQRGMIRTLFLFLFLICNIFLYGQQQKVRLTGKNDLTLKEAFKQIEKQTKLFVDYNVREVNEKQVIESTSDKEGTVDEIMRYLLKNSDCEFFYRNGHIIISKKRQVQQNEVDKKISGLILDEAEIPVIGANVVVKGTTNGVVTDINGEFSIEVKASDILQISYVGYLTQEIVVGNNDHINIRLREDYQTLGEVVVVGFGSQKKENLTGAVSQVKMEEVLGSRPVINTMNALQGAMPGLYISGASTPGQTKTFNIRGTTSINGGDPLVLIDNVPGDIDMINPEDIESVSILKDASSSAIYGARAAFGVILVTTKKAQKGDRFQVNYNNNFGFQSSVNRPEQLPALDFLKGYKDTGFLSGHYFPGQNIDKWIDYLTEYRRDPSKFNITGDGIYIPTEDNPAGTRYYLHEKDLYKNMLDDYGFLQTHNVSLSGGTEKASYRLSLGYNDEQGILYTDQDSYKRISGSMYVSLDMTDWLNQTVDARYGRTKKSMPNAGGNLYAMLLCSLTPEGEMESSDGMMLPVNTPRNLLLYNSYPTITSNESPRILSKTTLKPLEGLEMIFEYTYDKQVYDQKKYTRPVHMTSMQLGSSATEVTSKYENTKTSVNYNAINAYATYSRSFADKHHFKLMAGYNQESSRSEKLYSYRLDMINEEYPSFSSATGESHLKDTYSTYSVRGGFYRFNYDYEGRYLFEANGRYDGSSKFPKANRYGFFPSFSLGWNLAKESFMTFSNNWLEELKIRGSWGQIGNQAIDPYAYTPTMEASKADWIMGGERPTTLGVPALVSDRFTWETVETFDIGLDASLFKNRLRLTYDWYIRDTKDMLAPGMELPKVVGASAPLQNVADLRTKGWELTLSWRDRVGDWGYNVGFNLYDSKTKITKYDNEGGLISSYYVGQELGEIWGYTSDGYYSVNDFEDINSWKLKEGVVSVQGVNVKPGDVKFKNLMDDENSVNRIDPGMNTLENPGDRKVIGNNTPRYHFGFDLGVSWKDLSLSVLLQGVGKRDYWTSYARFPFSGSQFGTVFDDQLDYWKPQDLENGDYGAVKENPMYFRIYNQCENYSYNTRNQTKYLLNASYLRVKNITVSYIIPRTLVRKTGLTTIKLFTSIENLHTFSSLPSGYDPERLSWNYPFYRTISFGLNVTL